MCIGDMTHVHNGDISVPYSFTCLCVCTCDYMYMWNQSVCVERKEWGAGREGDLLRSCLGGLLPRVLDEGMHELGAPLAPR